MNQDRLTVAHQDDSGRVLIVDSMSYVDETCGAGDVIVAASNAGVPTAGWGLRQGIKAFIAHAAGVGKEDAGISGLSFSQQHGLPAAAVETMSARIGEGLSAYEGIIGHLNEAAASLGVEVGQPVQEAARLMLNASRGQAIETEWLAGKEIETMEETPEGNIYAVWGFPAFRRLNGKRPRDVFCTGTHMGKTLVEPALALGPRGVFSNDAGMAKDNSGVSALPVLAEAGIAAAAASSDSACIGDAVSTYRDGVCSAVNEIASAKGVRVGMTIKEAAQKLFE
jgi:hypothetical protein